jgi:hypothetical protein
MKTIKAFGLTLVAALALACVVATSATAYEWKRDGNALSTALTLTGESTLTFENYDGSRYSCTIVRKGKVGPGAVGEVTSVTSKSGAKAIPCTVLKQGTECASNVEIEAVSSELPWHTEISSESRNLLTGQDEWKISCKGPANEAATNWCVVPFSTGLINVRGGVEQVYDGISPHTGCLYGHNFVMTGSEQLKAAEGTLSVGTSATPLEWQLSGVVLSKSVGTTWKGKISVDDPQNIGLECEDTAEGTAGLYGGGTIAKLTASKCVSLQACKNNELMSFEALHLPWNTEMVSEGSAQDKIVGAGNGTPGFKLKCRVSGFTITEECFGALRAEASNGVGGVNAVFDNTEKPKCRVGTSELEATLGGTQTLTASGGTLEVQ